MMTRKLMTSQTFYHIVDQVKKNMHMFQSDTFWRHLMGICDVNGKDFSEMLQTNAFRVLPYYIFNFSVTDV